MVRKNIKNIIWSEYLKLLSCFRKFGRYFILRHPWKLWQDLPHDICFIHLFNPQKCDSSHYYMEQLSQESKLLVCPRYTLTYQYFTIHNRHLKISPKSLLVITYSEGMRRVFQERFKDYTEPKYLATSDRITVAMFLCFL